MTTKGTYLLLNVLLALLWMCMWSAFDIYTLAAGLALGMLLLMLVTSVLPGQSPYGLRLFRALRYAVYFIMILIQSNWVVARAVLAPRLRLQSRILRYPVEGMTPVQITVLANSISLTPGTLSIDVARDNKWLYVHCMDGPDRKAVIRSLDELRDQLQRGVFR